LKWAREARTRVYRDFAERAQLAPARDEETSSVISPDATAVEDFLLG